LKKYGAFAKIQISAQAIGEFQLTAQAQDSPLQWQAELHHLSLALPLSAFVTSQGDNAAKWRAYWLEAGVPLLDQTTQGLFRPHDLNLPELNAVCFTKGCYPGQEIVARMHYRGKPKVHLQRLILKTPGPLPAPGEIMNLPEQGTITVIDALRLNADHVSLTAVMSDAAFSSLPSLTVQGQVTPWQTAHD